MTQVPTSAINGGNRPLPTRGGLLLFFSIPPTAPLQVNSKSALCLICFHPSIFIRPNGGWKKPSPRVTFPTSSWMAASQQGKA